MGLLFFPVLGYSRSKLRRRLDGKTVLVTGASYGVGESLTEQLAKTGAKLLLVARTEDKLNVVKARVEAAGGHAEVFPCDLSNSTAVQALIEKLLQRPDGVDVLISNAGKSIRRSVFDSLDRFHDFTRTMNLNYLGPVQLLLGLIPGLVQRGGHAINISTGNAVVLPAPKWAAYQASKAAFDQWFRSVGPELNARGVATTSIYLPLVRTRMSEPTEHLKKLPALQPEQAASLICRAINSRKRWYKPWWLWPTELGSVLFRRPFEAIATWRLRRQLRG
jgi:short-subunit dehydrogenase